MYRGTEYGGRNVKSWRGTSTYTAQIPAEIMLAHSKDFMCLPPYMSVSP